MTAVETIRLNREDFVNWLAAALSGGLVWPARQSDGSEKPTDVTLARARRRTTEWPAVCVPRDQIQDLFAFVSTYTKARPFSAFFRVLPLDLISVLQPSKSNRVERTALARCVAGAAMSETWIASARNADRPRNVLPLLLSSLSATLGQVVLAGYEEAAFDWALGAWAELQRSPVDVFRQKQIEGVSHPWRLVLRAISETPQPQSDGDHLIASFVSKALSQGSFQPETFRLLAPLAGSLNLPALLNSSREERINRFNNLVVELKRRDERGTRAEFLLGLMLAIAGNGNFELLRSAREFDGWLDGAVTWFGFCAALFEESNILTYASSAGRRLVRDLSPPNDPSAPPWADIASAELRFLVGIDAISQIETRSPRSIDVEILPAVVTRVTVEAPENDRQERGHTDMLLQSLDEAGYLIRRARQLAAGFHADGREGPSTKSSRRGKR